MGTWHPGRCADHHARSIAAFIPWKRARGLRYTEEKAQVDLLSPVELAGRRRPVMFVPTAHARSSYTMLLFFFGCPGFLHPSVYIPKERILAM